MMTGVELIAVERQRQIEIKGWTLEHDAGHEPGELARAAACYALTSHARHLAGRGCRTAAVPDWIWLIWPWQPSDWKPTPLDRLHELVKAGALIAAEIDRVQRQASSP